MNGTLRVNPPGELRKLSDNPYKRAKSPFYISPGIIDSERRISNIKLGTKN